MGHLKPSIKSLRFHKIICWFPSSVFQAWGMEVIERFSFSNVNLPNAFTGPFRNRFFFHISKGNHSFSLHSCFFLMFQLCFFIRQRSPSLTQLYSTGPIHYLQQFYKNTFYRSSNCMVPYYSGHLSRWLPLRFATCEKE